MVWLWPLFLLFLYFYHCVSILKISLPLSLERITCPHSIDHTLNKMSDDVYSDLVGFLKSDRADLCLAAVKAVAAVTDEDDLEKLVKYGAVTPLCKLISRSETAELAMDSLLRLSSEAPSFSNQTAHDMFEAGIVNRVLEVLFDKSKKKPKFVNAALAVLLNTTRTEAGAVALLGPEDYSRPLPLLARFLLPTQPDEEIDQWQHFGGILMNLTQIEGGRKFVARISTKILEKILPQLRSKNVFRRRGIAGTVKNLCFDKDSAWWLLHEIDIIKHLLYPLAGETIVIISFLVYIVYICACGC